MIIHLECRRKEWIYPQLISNLVLNKLVCLVESQYSYLISFLKPKMIVSNTCSIRSGKMDINAAGAGLQKAIGVKPGFICDVRRVIMMNW
jgi:hypothetical protein